MSSSGRYPNYSQEANDLLDFARSVRRFASRYPDQICAGDILQHVDRFASNYGWDLLELVLDYEEMAAKLNAPRKQRT
jgi:hypothetical protein